jgi:hypothetical protein
MECYLVIKKNEAMLFVGKWKQLEIIVLNELSQAQLITCFHSYVEARPNNNKKTWF